MFLKMCDISYIHYFDSQIVRCDSEPDHLTGFLLIQQIQKYWSETLTGLCFSVWAVKTNWWLWRTSVRVMRTACFTSFLLHFLKSAFVYFMKCRASYYPTETVPHFLFPFFFLTVFLTVLSQLKCPNKMVVHFAEAFMVPKDCLPDWLLL